ncbi:reverse transcriptase domain-containing protein [Tanacetum coccineum]
MQMIWEIQFDGRIQSDPRRHVTDFLEISSLFQYDETQEEAVKLMTFPFSLSGKAKTWLKELDEGTITSWNKLREAFVSRYFSLEKFKRLLNEIHNFHQFEHETFIDAWLHMKEMLHTYYGHGLRNHQAIIENLKRQFGYIEKIMRTESPPRTTNTKPRHEIFYKPPSIRNENDKGDVEFIEEDKIKPIPTMPSPKLINSNSPTVSPFLKDCTVHIQYTQGIMKENVFEKDVLSNDVGDMELKSIDGIGIGRMTNKEIKKDDKGMLKEPKKE